MPATKRRQRRTPPDGDGWRWFTVEGAADYLDIPERAVRWLVTTRKLTAYKPGRRLLFQKDDLDDCIETSRLD